MIKRTLLVVLGLAAAAFASLLGTAATRPAAWQLERSADLAASADALFDQIDDLHRNHDWSPWAHVDPAMQVTYSGAPRGVGASYAWAGNADAGAGSMTITASTRPTAVELDLTFSRPVASTSTVRYRIVDQGATRRVSWSMACERPLWLRAVALVVDVDGQLAADFDRGLQALGQAAAAADSGAAQPAAAPALPGAVPP